MKTYTYLLLHVFTVIFPLSCSFESRIGYAKKWKYLFSSLILVAIFFIVWDFIFTSINIWNFNEEYLTGIFLGNLPLEECLFFFTVPFSCVFIYESLNYFIKKDYLGPYSRHISNILTILLFSTAILNYSKLYTSVTFFLTGLALLIHRMVFGSKYLGRFFIAYIVHLIPFFIVNGILTSLPVVTYNDTQNLGIRLGTIPLEDTMYSMLLLLMNISLYEYFQLNKKFKFGDLPNTSKI